MSSNQRVSVLSASHPSSEIAVPTWYWQFSFWGFLAVISFFTLTLWYSQPSLPYIAPTILQSLLGMAFSYPVQKGILRVWHQPWVNKIAVSLLFVAIASSLWTMARMQIHQWMTGETHIWQEFGGWYFSSIFIFLSWASLFFGLRYYQLLQAEHKVMLKAEAEVKEEQIKRMRAQSIAKDAQMKMLRYQLNPHFLCNTLNAVNALVEVGEAEKAQSMTVKLSQFLRHSLDNIPNAKITLENEINALNLYLQIEKIRFEDRLNLDFQISPDALIAFIPSLLLQPIIENSMKHAIAKCENGGTISLKANVQNDRLNIEISDSGTETKIGTSKLNSVIGRGVGLKNTDERLKVLYGEDYSFDIDTIENSGLRTKISIPFEPSTAQSNE